eukprot:gnl/TRDRNA2_/TRDRNA2_176723_c0_seq1.p1 gnl/TRDRNA2_/TRDRNA2_176723_c0~~gnl/TRDRNA2_/TRDRNA2_176723_c0_seq1.p1  ORF type:complete len:304 (-),score=-21.56 gnl/TRDRNA2_/TRDRNA2_176723_c0_seq1:62-973(-)
MLEYKKKLFNSFKKSKGSESIPHTSLQITIFLSIIDQYRRVTRLSWIHVKNFIKQTSIVVVLDTIFGYYASNIISAMGIFLRLSSLVLSASQILFRRFFALKTFTKHHVSQVAMASLWLACKIKVIPLKINIFLLTHQCLDIHEQGIVNARPVITNSCEIIKMKNSIVWHEMKILRAMGFFCTINNIENSLYPLVQTLRKSNVEPKKIMEETRIASYDSLHTDISVNYSSEAISCGIVYFVEKKLGVPLLNVEYYKKIFGVSVNKILRICAILCETYIRQTYQAKKLKLRRVSLNNYFSSNLI